MTDVGILRKEDHGIGKKVEYSLTENAIKQARLNLIGVPKERIILFKKIYQTILFNDISESMPIRVEVEDDFDKLILAELHVKRSDLQWRRIPAADTVDSDDLIYQTRSLRDSRTITKEYWAEREDESPVLENIEFICYPKGNFGIILKRIEYWQFNRYSENTKYHQEYSCELPGFSIEEIFASKRFNDDDVNFAFNALRALKLIEPIMEFHGKTRFIISDRRLHEFLINMWIIHEKEFSFQVKKWKYFDAPTSEEKNRIRYLLGEKEAARFFRQVGLVRSQHNLDLRKFRTTEEYTEYIKKDCSDFWESLVIDLELDNYKEQIRGNKKLVTDKDKKDDLLKFVNFRKEGLYKYLKYLPGNYGDEGIEELKMDYKDIREKYAFFQPVLKEICPKAFEANDDSE